MFSSVSLSKRIGAVLVISASAAVVAFSAGASERPGIEPAAPLLSVFSRSAIAGLDDPTLGSMFQPAPVASGKIRVLGSSLGRFHSRLIVGTTQDGKTICYGILGESAVDPAFSYCYQPKNPDLPEGLAGEHFDASAPEAVVDGEVGVQLFGIAFDDVRSIRAKIAGEWHNVPLARNGFYLDLPDIRYEQVGVVEATLSDGSIQIHDIQKGL